MPTDLGAWLDAEFGLDMVKKALAREETIRGVMAETGESREVVMEALDAMEAMGQEAVLDLTQGNPTTLWDGLEQYMNVLGDRDEIVPRDHVLSDLAALLAYPWSKEEEAVISSHDANESVRLEVTQVDSGFNVHTSIKVGGVEVYRDRDDREGASIEEVAEAVHRAVLARVIGDRDHHVYLNARQTLALRTWLTRPNGTFFPEGESRVSVDAVEDGGLAIRTRPYKAPRD